MSYKQFWLVILGYVAVFLIFGSILCNKISKIFDDFSESITATEKIEYVDGEEIYESISNGHYFIKVADGKIVAVVDATN